MADVCSSSAQSSRTQVGTTHLYVLKVSLRREYCSFLKGSKTLRARKNFSGSATSVVPGVQSGVHFLDDQPANTRQQVNQRFFAIRYNVLFNLLKVTKLYIFCIFFNLVIIAKFLSDWILVNINPSITFPQRQLSIIEEIPKIHHQ